MSITTSVKVSGMSCKHCAATVKEALETLPTVTKVDVQLKQAAAVIKSTDSLDPEMIKKVIEDSGYQYEGIV
ncbi:MAG: heavy-metal-associated domain-containing protein [Coriobacteriales bacterium]|nr:heavy-metal-associated domain-containing protein [Coriobacteriales bacterium]